MPPGGRLLFSAPYRGLRSASPHGRGVRERGRQVRATQGAPATPLLDGAAFTSVLLVAACSGQPGAQPAAAVTAAKAAPAPPVSAEQVRRGDIQQSLAYSGDIRAREQISVLPKSTGRIQQVLVDV